MKRRSLRTRLVLAALVPVLLAVLGFGLATALINRHELRGALDRALRNRAADVARLAVSAPAVLTSPGALEAPAGGREVAVEVLDARGRILARSVALGPRLLPVDALARRVRATGRPGLETISLGSQRLRLLAAPVADAGGPAAGGLVLVASDVGDIEATSRRLLGLLAVTALVTVTLASALAYGLTRRGLLPLRRLSGAARGIERTADPTRRLAVPEAGDEVEELARTLNGMLAALGRAREAERRFLADASHELRTPVTALLGNVEYAARHGAEPEVMADLRADAARLARLVDDLLALERAGAGHTMAEPVDLAEVARAAGAGDALVEAAEPVSVAGDRDALVRAVRNLVENARTHGPVVGAIRVRVGRDGGTAILSVSDDGEGPPPGAGAQVWERFWRGPDAAGRPGSGLGLAIVASVAAAHGGTASVAGATFTLRLPIAA